MDPECDQANFNLEAVCMMSEGAYFLWLAPNQWSSWDIGSGAMVEPVLGLIANHPMDDVSPPNRNENVIGAYVHGSPHFYLRSA